MLWKKKRSGRIGMTRRYIGMFLMLFMLLTGSITAGAAGLSLNAPVTEKNVIALMKQYDSDAAYILKNCGDSSYTRWWNGRSQIITEIDTCVHEQCHVYTQHRAGWSGENIYTGGKTVYVPYTRVYNSSMMLSHVPANLRTLRFSTYVGAGSGNMASNIQGVYGLLNEFTAYYWGMHSMMSLYPYLEKNTAENPQIWWYYISSGENGRMAYEEFSFFIYEYLLYAKAHYPEIYKGIINNNQFRKAFGTISTRFEKQIANYEKSLPKIVSLLKKKGYSAEYSNGFLRIGYMGRGGGNYSEYTLLKKQLSGSRYVGIRRLLGGTASLKTTQPSKTTKTSKTTKQSKTTQTSKTTKQSKAAEKKKPVQRGTSNTCVTPQNLKTKSTAAGIKITWKKSAGAAKYRVFRKEKGGKWKRIGDTISTGFIDKKTRKNKNYWYTVRCMDRSGKKYTSGYNKTGVRGVRK